MRLSSGSLLNMSGTKLSRMIIIIIIIIIKIIIIIVIIRIRMGILGEAASILFGVEKRHPYLGNAHILKPKP